MRQAGVTEGMQLSAAVLSAEFLLYLVAATQLQWSLPWENLEQPQSKVSGVVVSMATVAERQVLLAWVRR